MNHRHTQHEAQAHQRESVGRCHRPVREWSATPAPLLQQPLEILPSGNQERLTVDSPQPSQAETPHAMPVLAFGKERFTHTFRLRIAFW